MLLATVPHDFQLGFGDFLRGRREEGGEKLGVVSVSSYRFQNQAISTEQATPKSSREHMRTPFGFPFSHRAGVASPNSSGNAHRERNAGIAVQSTAVGAFPRCRFQSH